eukprot:TRINITY_DN15831_c0_g1_i1.p1 TRINITY_DN15831_c0_g1~~TRINITY_DN15831_c0_g1_i1.p1  ORF type:complete len:120 (-),score=31.19 TRINITY_DN15831_c0_g1_i1:131-490(-)
MEDAEGISELKESCIRLEIFNNKKEIKSGEALLTKRRRDKDEEEEKVEKKDVRTMKEDVKEEKSNPLTSKPTKAKEIDNGILKVVVKEQPQGRDKKAKKKDAAAVGHLLERQPKLSGWD